jgi:hypothetical protein
MFHTIHWFGGGKGNIQVNCGQISPNAKLYVSTTLVTLWYIIMKSQLYRYSEIWPMRPCHYAPVLDGLCICLHYLGARVIGM